jgi:hypothetical protein
MNYYVDLHLFKTFSIELELLQVEDFYLKLTFVGITSYTLDLEFIFEELRQEIYCIGFF